MPILLKTNLFGFNFVNFDQFGKNQYLRNFHSQKLITAKNFPFNPLARINWNSDLLDFIIRSFSLMKKQHSFIELCIIVKMNTCKICEILWAVFVFPFKIFPKTAAIQIYSSTHSFFKSFRTLNGALYFSFPNTIKLRK